MKSLEHPRNKDGIKTAIMLNGSLHCPYCKSPLTTEEVNEKIYRCIYCGGAMGKLSDDIIIQLARAVTSDTLQEWEREVKYYSTVR